MMPLHYSFHCWICGRSQLFADSCAGSCGRTCTGDNRKYDDLAGLGGPRTAVLVDNVLCTANDPYGGQNSILVHEFAHTVHRFGQTDETMQKAGFAQFEYFRWKYFLC